MEICVLNKKAFKIFIKWIKQKKWDFEAEYIQNKG